MPYHLGVPVACLDPPDNRISIVFGPSPAVVDAVEAALAIQQRVAAENSRIRLRIGINLGDVIIDGDDIYGDGVNVAARLEALAEPGGICIASIVHESIGNRIEAEFADAGAHEVKGIDRPIQVWQWPATGVAQTPLALPDKPSIAILPFDNMSSDPEQDFFAEGIAEDIITELSKFRSLFVIARNSSFAFKGQALEVKEIGKRLGVRYVVEGSVRRAGNRVRITAQLIDALDDTHLWAERYDRDLADIFAVLIIIGVTASLALTATEAHAAESLAAAAPTGNVTTGTRMAMDSSNTLGNPSLRLERTKTSAASSISLISFLNPTSLTVVPKSY